MSAITQTIVYLRAQCARYPALEIQDLLKALHQSVYGCGHFAAPPSWDLLTREFASLPPDAAADAEPLDGDFCRLHLGYAAKHGLSAETLHRMFILSAQSPAGSEPELRAKLAALLNPAARLPFSHQELSAAVERWRAEGFPACHHSPAFRAAYHPAYRVIRRKFVPLLSLLSAIDRGLAALSPEHRQILILREMHQLSYDEIAEALSLDTGTVKSRISRARRQLRNFLLKDGNFSPPAASKATGKEG